MTRKIQETNSDRMVQKSRAPVKQPESAGTGPQSKTYQQRIEEAIPKQISDQQTNEQNIKKD